VWDPTCLWRIFLPFQGAVASLLNFQESWWHQPELLHHFREVPQGKSSLITSRSRLIFMKSHNPMSHLLYPWYFALSNSQCARDERLKQAASNMSALLRLLVCVFLHRLVYWDTHICIYQGYLSLRLPRSQNLASSLSQWCEQMPDLLGPGFLAISLL
jgi:hypothetical protein